MEPLEPGSTFRWKAGVSMVSTLCVVEPPNRVAWEGRARGIYARHVWKLERIGAATSVETAESFEGAFPRILGPLMRRVLSKSLDDALAELKAAVEASS
jgi:hypothetical protein